MDAEFTRVFEEYNKRLSTVQAVADEIVTLWTDLGTPQAQIDSDIVKNYRETPEQLGLRSDDIKRLKTRRDKLLEEKSARERRLKDLKITIETLWDKLDQDMAHRKAFAANNRGCGLRAINEHEDELARLEELKRQNLHIFVEDARFKLQKLWDDLYFSEEEMLDFAAAFSGKSPLRRRIKSADHFQMSTPMLSSQLTKQKSADSRSSRSSVRPLWPWSTNTDLSCRIVQTSPPLRKMRPDCSQKVQRAKSVTRLDCSERRRCAKE